MSNHGVSPNPPKGEPRAPQGSGVKDQKRRPPESERYDELKGKSVLLVLEAGRDGYVGVEWTGVLRWVDRYTIGVFIQTPSTGQAQEDQVWIINKAKIVAIGEA